MRIGSLPSPRSKRLVMLCARRIDPDADECEWLVIQLKESDELQRANVNNPTCNQVD